MRAALTTQEHVHTHTYKALPHAHTHTVSTQKQARTRLVSREPRTGPTGHGILPSEPCCGAEELEDRGVPGLRTGPL